MLHQLEPIIQAWQLVLTCVNFMRTHYILGDCSFLDLLVCCICLDILFWAIGRLLPGFLGAENTDVYDPGDNPYNVRSEYNGSFSYGNTYDVESNWSRF